MGSGREREGSYQYGRDIDQNVKNHTFQSLSESHCIIHVYVNLMHVRVYIRGVRHSFKKCTRFRNLLIYRKISGFHERFQDFTKDFGIPGEISRFHGISRKISGFQERFQDFTKDLGLLRRFRELSPGI